jgi:hypothetical protein
LIFLPRWMCMSKIKAMYLSVTLIQVSRNFITFRSTWAHPIFLVGFFSFLCNVLYIRLPFFSFDPCVVCPKIYGLELTVPFGIYTLFFLIKNILSICCNRVLNHSRLSVVNIWLPLLGGPLGGGGDYGFLFSTMVPESP